MFEVVPAETLMVPCVRATVTEAVMTEPFRPNETLLLFENVRAERLLLVVPALTLMFVSDVAIDAVMVEAFRPNEIPFEFENVKAEARFEVVPAERLMEACVRGDRRARRDGRAVQTEARRCSSSRT